MRTTSFALVKVLFALLVVNGCASLEPAIWPPTIGERTYPVFVSLDNWHGMIGFPRNISTKPEFTDSDDKNRSGSAGQQSDVGYEEWGYAERDWYVGGQQRIWDALRALFWPTPGTVEIARYQRVWTYRTPQPPADLFLFQLTHEGLLRLRRHLFSTLAETEPMATVGHSKFYPSRRAYHLFHNCHHYVARALREAGLPVSPFWAISRTLLAMQLRRAERLAEELASSHTSTPKPENRASYVARR